MELPTQLEGVSKNAAKNIYIYYNTMGNFPSCLSSIAHADIWTYRLMDWPETEMEPRRDLEKRNEASPSAPKIGSPQKYTSKNDFPANQLAINWV